jgi:hypothetical protein
MHKHHGYAQARLQQHHVRHDPLVFTDLTSSGCHLLSLRPYTAGFPSVSRTWPPCGPAAATLHASIVSSVRRQEISVVFQSRGAKLGPNCYGGTRAGDKVSNEDWTRGASIGPNPRRHAVPTRISQATHAPALTGKAAHGCSPKPCAISVGAVEMQGRHLSREGLQRQKTQRGKPGSSDREVKSSPNG